MGAPRYPPTVTGFLDRDSPVARALAPMRAGASGWPKAKAALLAMTYAPDPRVGTKGMTDPNSGWLGQVETEAEDIPPGSFREVQEAADWGVITQEQYRELAAAQMAMPARKG